MHALCCLPRFNKTNRGPSLLAGALPLFRCFTTQSSNSRVHCVNRGQQFVPSETKTGDKETSPVWLSQFSLLHYNLSAKPPNGTAILPPFLPHNVNRLHRCRPRHDTHRLHLTLVGTRRGAADTTTAAIAITQGILDKTYHFLGALESQKIDVILL